MTFQERLKYPQPNFIRTQTEIINDGWEFSFDGKEWQDINLPFCPESKLSGIEYKDFILQCFYRKTLRITKNDQRITIRFGAVDYRCALYVNGKCVGSHVGGYTPFSFDITDALNDGENELYLVVHDDELLNCPSGKQSSKRESYGCFYTRTTGIWQDVWIEFAPIVKITQAHFYPSAERQSVTVDLLTSGLEKCTTEIFYDNRLVGSFCGEVEYHGKFEIKLDEKHLWELGNGRLYDVKISFGDDVVYSYFGLRDVSYQGYDFMLNGNKVFQKLVLDQGYYPDGIYTAPSVEAMKRDIKISFDLGFNGARLHQKVFEPRFLYLCDVSGYMVWGEFASWGVRYSDLDFLGRFLQEWEEVLARDFNHPSIVTWCPLNEVWGNGENTRQKRDVRFIELVYEFTKTYDVTRPCVDVSGGHHGTKTDLFDVHCYADEVKLKEYLDKFEKDDILDVPYLYCENEDLPYKKGIPVNLSEFGGILFAKKANSSNGEIENSDDSWGYGKGETDADALIDRYEALANVAFANRKLSGFCYTQLYDVEQEQNGFYYYDRSDKFKQEQKQRMREINSRRV